MFQLRNHSIQWNTLIISILLPLSLGTIASIWTKESVILYQSLIKPPFSPPGWIFPIVWSILYILMGISAYMIYTAPYNVEAKASALQIYLVQLLLNFMWTIAFFGFEAFGLALLLLIVLWFLILVMLLRFAKIDSIAALLLIPYLVWVSFAAYLNFGIVILN